jgi:hypothetical protein
VNLDVVSIVVQNYRKRRTHLFYVGHSNEHLPVRMRRSTLPDQLRFALCLALVLASASTTTLTLAGASAAPSTAATSTTSSSAAMAAMVIAATTATIAGSWRGIGIVVHSAKTSWALCCRKSGNTTAYAAFVEIELVTTTDVKVREQTVKQRHASIWLSLARVLHCTPLLIHHFLVLYTHSLLYDLTSQSLL